MESSQLLSKGLIVVMSSSRGDTTLCRQSKTKLKQKKKKKTLEIHNFVGVLSLRYTQWVAPPGDALFFREAESATHHPEVVQRPT